MGSPISPVLADLVMEVIEETAITTALHPPKWWFGYVDDSHSCLKRDQVNAFHQHLNSDAATNGHVVLPYVKGVSERIGRVLKQQSLRLSFQPQRTINSLNQRFKFSGVTRIQHAQRFIFKRRIKSRVTSSGVFFN